MYLTDGDVERDRRLVLTVHLYEDFEYTKDGKNEYDKEPIRRYLDTAIAVVNGLDPNNGIYWIKTWGLEARVGQYAAATEEGEISVVETGPGEYKFEGVGKKAVHQILDWIRVNWTPVDNQQL